MEESSLKPCPFCGGPAHFRQKSWDIFTIGVCVECDMCRARTDWLAGSSLRNIRKLAAESWNNRALKEE